MDNYIVDLSGLDALRLINKGELMFSKVLNKKLDKYHLLKHPFYRAWNEGKLNREIIKDYAEQYYQHVKAFPRYISATHSLCENIEKRKILLENLQDRLPNVNFIGIRVLSSRDGMRFARHYNADEKELNIMEKDWKKSKSYIIKNSGYDAYIVMSSHHLNQDSEFEVKEDATKSQIKTAFAKSLKTKKLNKKVLGEFISLVV